MKEPNRTCLVCGKRFYAKPSANRSCCGKACQKIYFKGNTSLLKGPSRGAGNPNWSGGRTINHGYVLILSPEHPNGDVYGYVKEHRLVMEKHLGRYLTRDEQIHHRDHNRSNNDILNLMYFPNNVEHRHYHGKYPKPQGPMESPWSPDIEY